MTWGQKVNHRDLSRPGWREDPERPGVDRYWTGSEWDDAIVPRATPNTGWLNVLVALLVAAAVVFAIYSAAT